MRACVHGACVHGVYGVYGGCACLCLSPDDAQFEAASEDQVCGVLRKVALSDSNFKLVKEMVTYRLTASSKDDCK